MMIFKKAIPRRTFLRGAGASLALPLLDSMVPAFAATNKSPVRLSIVYTSNGVSMEKWYPKTVGTGFQLSPALEPLVPYRQQLLVLSGLNNNAGDPLPGEGESAPHERAGAVFLTGVHPKREGRVAVTMDQIAAKELGKQTQLASLELGLHTNDVVGGCEKGWSCAYTNTISWSTPTTPLPIEYRPRAVFERLFGDNNSTDPAARLKQIRKEGTLLDSITEAASRLMAGLGPGDRTKISQYLDAIRDIERRIQMAEEQSSRELPVVDRPVGVPATFEEHAKLMFDLQVLAYQTDLTRVITFMVGRGQSNRTYREIGVPEAHHALSHHQDDPAKLEKLHLIDRYHATLFTYYLEKLRSTPDGDGSLLDHLMILYGSDMSDPNKHWLQDLPIVLVGGAGGQIKGGSHIRYPKDTPLTNLFLTMLEKLEIPIEHFGDSTGKLDLLPIA
jgi:Protein of unknown function (DUF1552)